MVFGYLDKKSNVTNVKKGNNSYRIINMVYLLKIWSGIPLNKRAQRALGRSPEKKVKGQDEEDH